MSKVQLLLLAAGRSSRMKEPKQLLPWDGKKLIEHQILNLLATGESLTVVMGAYAEKILPLIEPLPIDIVHNDCWEDGMGTSIAQGTSHLLEQHPNMDGILISLIDQPLLTTAHFNKMLTAFQPGSKQIIISKADIQWSGAPVLFDKTFIRELIQLKGDEGAKKVTNKHKDAIVTIDGGALLTDIDTPLAYQEVLQRYMKMK